MKFMSRKALLALFGLSVAVASGATYLIRREMNDLPRGGDFTLMSNHGPFSLHQLKGSVVVLYFGYTSCPDACPLAMSRLSRVLKSMPQDERRRIAPVFVSVDTRSDTPEKVAKYVSFFYSGAYGVTGTPSQLKDVTQEYGTFYMIEDDKSSALGYTVQHGTDFYLIDRSGNLVAEMPIDSKESALKDALVELL